MKRVLVVDDAAFMRKMLGDILRRNGYEVVGEAGNGLEAVERYKALRPDLVTMDITMPDIDGIQAVRSIKEFDPDCVIVMISAMGQRGMVLDAVQAGAKGFIVKPFQEIKIMEEISKLT